MKKLLLSLSFLLSLSDLSLYCVIPDVSLNNSSVQQYVNDNAEDIFSLLQNDENDVLYSQHFVPLLNQVIEENVDQSNKENNENKKFRQHPILNSEKKKKQLFNIFLEKLNEYNQPAGTN